MIIVQSMRKVPVLLVLFMAACGDNAGPGGGGADAGPGDGDPDAGGTAEIYAFDSRFIDGESSVAYSGQALRQVLINDLNAYINALTPTAPEDFPEDVLGDLLFYYEFDAAVGGEATIVLTTDPAPLQATYGAIGNANLKGKLAGNDAMGQHKDWTVPGTFVGWPGGDGTTPEELLLHFFAEVDAHADAYAAGEAPDDPRGNQITLAHLSADGLDYRQLVNKFLLVAVAYSQATDDYFDNDLADHGINVDNEVPALSGEEEQPYTQLEHHWDEGFGYFGAARDYPAYSDEEMEGIGGRAEFQKYHDSDGDDAIDLTAEYIYPWAGYAARRDNGSAESAPTDFTGEIFGALLTGRRIISTAGGALSEDQMADLVAERDKAVASWERLVAANVVHYINDVLKDMNKFEEEDYDFMGHAGHWAEAKAFALGLQFNPRKALTDEQFAELHQLLRVRPVLETATPTQINNYKADLRAARALIGDAYDFDAANLGDDNGENGW